MFVCAINVDVRNTMLNCINNSVMLLPWIVSRAAVNHEPDVYVYRCKHWPAYREIGMQRFVFLCIVSLHFPTYQNDVDQCRSCCFLKWK